MKIAVRLDDITPDMDWERFYAFKRILDQYQIKPLLGVIPDNRDTNISGSKAGAPEDFWAYVRALAEEGWSIALHGYRHLYTTDKGGMFPLNSFSEFAGLPYEQQRRMLKEGKRILAENGIETDLFMAPAHSYDNNTLRALKENGFDKITDGFGRQPYQWKGITFYPISFHLEKTFRQKTGYSTMVVHPGTIREDELPRYEEYFKRPGVEWISYREYMSQEPVGRTYSGRMKEFLMAVLKAWIIKIMARKI